MGVGAEVRKDSFTRESNSPWIVTWSHNALQSLRHGSFYTIRSDWLWLSWGDRNGTDMSAWRQMCEAQGIHWGACLSSMFSNCQKWAFRATIAWKGHNKKRRHKKSDGGLGLHQARELAEVEWESRNNWGGRWWISAVSSKPAASLSSSPVS